MASDSSGATIAPPERIGMTSRIDQHPKVYGGMSLAEVEEGREDQVEQKGEPQCGLPVFPVSQLAGEAKPTPALEIRERLTALVLNIAACRHWLSADPPDIRQARATMERMTSDARALAKCDSARGPDPNRRRKMTPACLGIYQSYQKGLDRCGGSKWEADLTSDRTRLLTGKAMR
jgi:hypothetical protein